MTAAADKTALLRYLLSSGQGKEHLRAASALALAASLRASPDEASGLQGLYAELCLAVFECDPFDARAAHSLLAAHGMRPFLSPELAALAQAAVAHSREPADQRYFARLAKQRDYPKIRNYLESMQAKEPGNTYWLGHELSLNMAEQNFEAALDLLAERTPEGLKPALPCLEAGLRFCLGDYQAAAELCRAQLTRFAWPPALLLLAECLLRLAAPDEAAQALELALTQRPWQIDALLKLYDLRQGYARLQSSLPGKTRILLYSFNKAKELGFTLESLCASELDPAGDWKIELLLNGCTDSSLEAAQSFARRLGPERFGLTELPVNVGAPAARNWLMRLKSVRNSDWCVYLDDDVELPGNWLSVLAAAKDIAPEAGVYGCRVSDYFRPTHIQSADLMLNPLPGEPGKLTRRFDHLCAYSQCLDFGQFNYARPCSSVTGCLHLFRTPELLELGGFDLRFSPSQYDDLDHDLRLLLKGKVPFYQGHLAIRHLKATGKISAEGGSGYGSGFANQFKLHHKHPEDELTRALNFSWQAVREDALRKWKSLWPGKPWILSWLGQAAEF